MSKDYNKEELRLRNELKKNPQSAKLCSQLSCLLVDRETQAGKAVVVVVDNKRDDNNNNNTDDNNNKNNNNPVLIEAWKLAIKATLLEPERPAGYMALSRASWDFKERFDALQMCIQLWNERCSMTHLCYVTCLIRAFLEPRQYLKEKLPLDSKEEKLYETKVKHHLERAHEEATLLSDIIVMVTASYKLGLFFRKLQPAHTNRPRAIYHLQQALQHLPTTTSLESSPIQQKRLDDNGLSRTVIQFWLQTMLVEQNNNNNDNNETLVVDNNDKQQQEQQELNKETKQKKSSFRHKIRRRDKKQQTTPTESTTTTTTTSPMLDRCPPQYIKSLYSTFAARFDVLLVDKLQYVTPTKLCQIVLQQQSSSNNNDDILWKRGLDLGCGTGLSGLAFGNYIQHLDGMDLSREMLDKAKQERSTSYQRLFIGDVVQPFHHAQIYHDNINKDNNKDDESSMLYETYDIIFACDVFCYVGNLKSIFQQVHQRLDNNENDGTFAFSVEYLDAPQNDNAETTKQNDGNNNNHHVSFQLHANARFAHAPHYLTNLTKETGFTIQTMQRHVLRKNGGKNVEGLLVVCKPTRDAI